MASLTDSTPNFMDVTNTLPFAIYNAPREPASTFVGCPGFGLALTLTQHLARWLGHLVLTLTWWQSDHHHMFAHLIHPPKCLPPRANINTNNSKMSPSTMLLCFYPAFWRMYDRSFDNNAIIKVSERERQRQRDRETDAQRERDRHTHTERETQRAERDREDTHTVHTHRGREKIHVARLPVTREHASWHLTSDIHGVTWDIFFRTLSRKQIGRGSRQSPK